MKFLRVYRITWIAALVLILPLALLASEGVSIDKPVRRELLASLSGFQDSIPSKRKPDKSREEAQKPPQEVRDERLREAQGRAIKQVPRSIPKLKPQPVSEGIKIRKATPKREAGVRRF